MAAALEEIGGVDGDDSGLVGLGNVSEDCVHHGDLVKESEMCRVWDIAHGFSIFLKQGGKPK